MLPGSRTDPAGEVVGQRAQSPHQRRAGELARAHRRGRQRLRCIGIPRKVSGHIEAERIGYFGGRVRAGADEHERRARERVISALEERAKGVQVGQTGPDNKHAEVRPFEQDAVRCGGLEPSAVHEYVSIELAQPSEETRQHGEC